MSADSAPPALDSLRTRLSTQPGVTLALLAGALATLYFGLFNHDFSVNGLRYADDVERGIELWHPNHLLPNVIYRAIYLAGRALGLGDLRAIWSMQALNACAGIAAALAVARIATLRADRSRALLLGGLYALGFAAWTFAQEPDVYVLPAAAVAISLALLAGREQLSWRAVVVLGVLAVFAVLTLQQYVLWYPALLALVARRQLGAARSAKVRLLAFGIPGACLAAYLAVGAALGQLHSLGDALGWFLGYAWNTHGGFATYREAPALSARLLGTLLGLGNLAFAYEVILSGVAVCAALAGVGVLAWLAVRVAIGVRREQTAVRRDATIIALWMAANLVFATWWESRNIEFLFPFWLGALALAALAAAHLDRRILALALVLVGGVNLGVAFWPQRDFPERYRVAGELARHEHLTAADVLVTEELNTIGYLHYFQHVDVRFQVGAVSALMHIGAPAQRSRAAIDAALASGARVYTTELDENGRLREIARRFALLGRDGFDGSVDRELAELYRGLDVSNRPVAGVRRLRATP